MSNRHFLFTGILFLLGVACFAWLFLRVDSDRPLSSSSRRANVSNIALAIHRYHKDKNTLPPAAICDHHGRPLLSWRVAILPYVEQEELFRQFRLNEAWDSPRNQALISKMPGIFYSHQKLDSAGLTHYQVIVGKQTAFDGTCRGLNLNKDFPDDPANTILLVEGTDKVVWTKPDDLSFQPDQPWPKIGWPDYFHAAMCDGPVRRLPTKLSEATLRALITRNGGEKLAPDWDQ